MEKFTEAELTMIKYALSFLHDRDLSLFYTENFISVLESVMKKLEIDFIPQSEIDKKKIKEYYLCYNNNRRGIIINRENEKDISDIFTNAICEIIKNNNIKKDIRIAMNKNTYDKLSESMITMKYVVHLCGFEVFIDDSCFNGEMIIQIIE